MIVGFGAAGMLFSSLDGDLDSPQSFESEQVWTPAPRARAAGCVDRGDRRGRARPRRDDPCARGGAGRCVGAARPERRRRGGRHRSRARARSLRDGEEEDAVDAVEATLRAIDAPKVLVGGELLDRPGVLRTRREGRATRRAHLVADRAHRHGDRVRRHRRGRHAAGDRVRGRVRDDGRARRRRVGHRRVALRVERRDHARHRARHRLRTAHGQPVPGGARRRLRDPGRGAAHDGEQRPHRLVLRGDGRGRAVEPLRVPGRDDAIARDRRHHGRARVHGRRAHADAGAARPVRPPARRRPARVGPRLVRAPRPAHPAARRARRRRREPVPVAPGVAVPERPVRQPRREVAPEVVGDAAGRGSDRRAVPRRHPGAGVDRRRRRARRSGRARVRRRRPRARRRARRGGQRHLAGHGDRDRGLGRRRDQRPDLRAGRRRSSRSRRRRSASRSAATRPRPSTTATDSRRASRGRSRSSSSRRSCCCS